MPADANLLRQLLERGDRVSIVKGRLCIEPASGIPVPPEWLKANSRSIITEVLQSTGQDGLFYESFTTGTYATKKSSDGQVLRMSPGLTLQFTSIYEIDAYAIFNCSLTYDRGQKKGKRYPGKRFRVGQRSAFVKFWRSCGLPIRRLSDFDEYMGNLQDLAFQASRAQEKIVNSTLAPVRMSADSVRQAILTDNAPTDHRQSTDKVPTTITDKESPQSQAASGLQANPTTCGSNCELTVVRECVQRGLPSPPDIPPTLQTNDEWLADYESVDFNLRGTLQ